MRFIAVLLVFSSLLNYGQTGSWMLNNESTFFHFPAVSVDTGQIHTGIRPFRIKEVQSNWVEDSTGSRWMNNHLIESSHKKIHVDPVITSMMYLTNDDTEQESEMDFGFEGQIGVNGHWDITPKLSIHGTYFYCQADFNSFQDTFISSEKSMLGLGELNDQNKDVFSSHFFAGKITFRPDELFEFEIGHDKHFIGNGYRSMILSDHSDPYSYLKITTSFWKVKYMNLFAAQKHVDEINLLHTDATQTETTFRWKYSSLHYLSMNFGKRLNLALFESVIWGGRNNEFERGFDPRYLNPVIFYRPVEFAVGSPDNVQLGMEASYVVGKHNLFYGQLMLDEFLLSELRAGNGWWGNKYAVQFGVLVDNAMGIEHLRLRLEGNVVRPYTFTHGSSVQNYGHLNRPLAHPLGANFQEVVVQINYKKNRMMYSAQANIAEKGYDGVVDGVTNFTNYGGDIFLSNKEVPRNREYGNFIGQGVAAQNIFIEAKAAYVLNPRWNLAFELGGRSVVAGPDKSINETQLFFGLRTRLYNQYLDYF